MQQTIFDVLYPKFKIDKPIRLIELFAGYGSQALALKYLGVKFEHWKICEWAVKSIQAYKDIHFTDDKEDYSKMYSKEYLIEQLHYWGISNNYNDPMPKEQIKRLSEDKIRQIYNNIIATHNLVNIQQAKGEDLEINDKDHCYIMTYSFPCQDLSLAGNGKGMHDNSTRSGMLWEVERILKEISRGGGLLPNLLLMENVPQVHSQDNMKDFHKWQCFLESLGYKNYFQDLIATDYGIPQIRNRCFMVSILGDYSYTFPKPTPLKLKLKDMLESNVPEKYYLSQKMVQGMINTKFHQYQLENRLQDLESSIDTLTTSTGERAPHVIKDIPKLPIKNATNKGYLEAELGDGIDISSRMEYHRGTVQKGKSQTITTMGGGRCRSGSL